MKQIADQPSAAKADKLAPKKRPNDTVKREQSATNNKQTKVVKKIMAILRQSETEQQHER